MMAASRLQELSKMRSRQRLRAKFILPALTEATCPYWRPIKDRCPTLGLATLAAYLIQTTRPRSLTNVAPLHAGDRPDLVAIRSISPMPGGPMRWPIRARQGSLRRPRRPARHRTSRRGSGTRRRHFSAPASKRFRSSGRFRSRTASGSLRINSDDTDRLPPIRRDLISRRPIWCRIIVVTRGCPQHCDLCYKKAFFYGWAFFYN